MVWVGITPWPFIPIPTYFPIEFSYLGHLRHSSFFMQCFCENSFLWRNHLFMAYLIWNSIEKNTAQFHDRAALFHWERDPKLHQVWSSLKVNAPGQQVSSFSEPGHHLEEKCKFLGTVPNIVISLRLGWSLGICILPSKCRSGSTHFCIWSSVSTQMPVPFF